VRIEGRNPAPGPLACQDETYLPVAANFYWRKREEARLATPKSLFHDRRRLPTDMFERTGVKPEAPDHKDTSAGKNQDKQLPKVLRHSFLARF
jgi:hypothetical protein